MYVHNTVEQERDRLRAELDRERKEHAEEKVATAQMYGNSLRKLQLECSQFLHENESLQRKLEEQGRNHQIEMAAWKAEIERTRKEEAELEQKTQKEIKLLMAQIEQSHKEAQDDKEKLIQFYTAAIDQKEAELARAQAKIAEFGRSRDLSADSGAAKAQQESLAATLERNRMEAEQANQTIRQLQEEKQTFMARLLQEQQKAQEVDQLQRQLAALTTELEAAKAQMALHLEAKDSRLEAKQGELQAELEASKIEFANALASAKERNRLDLEQLNHSVRQLEEEKRALVERNRLDLERLNHSVRQLEEEKRALVDRHRLDLEQLSHSVRQLEEEKRALAAELDREKFKNRDVDQMRRRVAELTAELQAKKPEHISILTSARERHNLEAEQTAAKLNHSLQQLQKETQEKQELMAELEKLKASGRRVTDLEAELKDIRLENAKLLATKAHVKLEASHEAAEFQADLEATRQEVAGVLAAQRARKRLETEEAEAKLARMSEELEATKAEVIMERERRQKEAEQAQEKLNQTIRRHYQQQQELTVEQEDQLSLALECAQLEKEKHALQMKLEAAAREHQSKLVEGKFELENVRKEVAQWKAEAERARNEAKEERERLIKERSVTQAELEQGKAKLKEFEQLQHKVAALSGELAARKVEYETTLGSEKERFRFETQKRDSTIHQQLDEIEGLTDQLSKDHQAEMMELEGKLKGEITQLKNELERTRQEAQGNQAKIVEEYTTTIRQLQQQLADRQIQPVKEIVQPAVHIQTVQPAVIHAPGQKVDSLPLDRRGSLTDSNIENEARRRRTSLGENNIVDSQPIQRRASLDSNIDTEAEVPLLNETLEKHSSSFPRRWQPRTCSLTTQKLFWISDKKYAKTAIGSVDLADMSSVATQEGDDNVFVIHARSRDGNERSFEFKAPDTTSRDKWISAINSAMTPAKQRRNSLVMEKVTEPEIRVTEITIRKDEPSEGKFHKLLALI